MRSSELCKKNFELKQFDKSVIKKQMADHISIHELPKMYFWSCCFINIEILRIVLST